MPTVVPNHDYNPNTTTANAAEFDHLVTVNLTNKTQAYFKNNLQQLLYDAANKDGIPVTFKTNPYNYTYNNQRDNYTVSMSTTAIHEQFFDVGYVIGLNGTINGKNSKCSEYKPTDFTKFATFFSKDWIDLFFSEFSSGFKGWSNYVVDSGNAKSPYFGFRIADLEPIIPSVTQSYQNLLDKVEARCAFDKDLDNQLYLNTDSSSVELQAGWNCQIFKVESKDPIISIKNII